MTTESKPMGAGEMFRAILARMAEGESSYAACEAVIPKPEPSPDGPRFRCGKCLDTGLVSVWHTLSVRACLADPASLDVARNRRTMIVACCCHAADQLCLPDDRNAPKNWQGWRQSARYAPESYCRCHGAEVNRPERIAELIEWVGDYHQKKNQAPAHMREQMFDNWNQR